MKVAYIDLAVFGNVSPDLVDRSRPRALGIGMNLSQTHKPVCAVLNCGVRESGKGIEDLQSAATQIADKGKVSSATSFK